ncbi:hypothetical protein [Pontibacter sp. HSC-36F09]|nr:hypothetical protein [Pontibacter sp. HSC-36F09]MCP2042019.1 hypothetical protein [Pontibacter sp. HSC-36F09]
MTEAAARLYKAWSLLFIVTAYQHTRIICTFTYTYHPTTKA